MAVVVVSLTAAMADEVADLYTRVFAGPPWFEIKRCGNCGEGYGKADDLERFHDGDVCRRCGRPLTLLDFWRGKRALDVYVDALARDRFVGVGARNGNGKLIAFSWGFAAPLEDTPTVKFGTVSPWLSSHGLLPNRTFYSAETGVDPAYQKQGVGTRVSYERLSQARDAGFENVCFRTINPALVRVYERLFGVQHIRELFSDPDPLNANDIWYTCRMAELYY